jgi:hypothetical protein
VPSPKRLCVVQGRSIRGGSDQVLFADEPADFCAGAFFLSAQRFFTATDMRFLAAALIPRFGFAAVAGATTLADDFDLRAAHRAFIAADRRRLPAGVIPLPRLGAPALPVVCRVGLAAPTRSSRASIALSNRSRSRFSSETILSRFNSNLLQDLLSHSIKVGPVHFQVARAIPDLAGYLQPAQPVLALQSDESSDSKWGDQCYCSTSSVLIAVPPFRCKTRAIVLK